MTRLTMIGALIALLATWIAPEVPNQQETTHNIAAAPTIEEAHLPPR